MSAKKKTYGKRVVCSDPASRWFGHVGRVAGGNVTSLGVVFDLDGAPPDTGRWVQRRHLQDVDAVSGEAKEVMERIRLS